ncbi:MAG: glycoside hydrolase family 27 protein [Deferribacteres bacterium]|nr:glycoside hydrolase family 27 protein [candidate division KSB1 bacterium]MCB9502179.1 glycoside hydrolase family 27 protein [Deferribacteres bacterium]
MKKLFYLLFIFATQTCFAQKFNGLAKTPPMGWNSWNKFACDVNEELIHETADAMVSSGMKDAGYLYINIDDCWHGKRDSLGFIHPDPERFPAGMKALADYIHAKGLKLGLYSDAGWKTCGGRPGSRGYEFQDAMQYAKWGIDYLKYDWCNTEGLNAEGAYLTMRDALFSAGRPIVFSMCEWGNNKPWDWGKKIGHLWRTTGDITNCFDCVVDHGTWKSWGVMQILDMQKGLRQHTGPDHWNDPDMMEVGNGMSVNEDRAHFSMWCMLAAPLIAGNDLRNMSNETVEILTNADAVAINQDKLGIQGFKYSAQDSLEIWLKPLENENWALCFLNRAVAQREINFAWQKNTISDSLSQKTLDFNKNSYIIHDVWAQKKIGTTQGKTLKTMLPGHDVRLLLLEMQN